MDTELVTEPHPQGHTITVQGLIGRLSQYDPHLPVLWWNTHCCHLANIPVLTLGVCEHYPEIPYLLIGAAEDFTPEAKAAPHDWCINTHSSG